jgi:UDP-N-acetylmuramoyl-tripeptide--D-alanyl-D-alanine ligase
MEKALQTFMELAKGCVQHLILGDMLDLGEASERSHMRILNLALVLGFDHLYLLGPQFKTAKDKISQLPKSCMHFEDISKLSEALLQAVQPEHAIFLKGSRGMKLEKILDPLLTKFPKT